MATIQQKVGLLKKASGFLVPRRLKTTVKKLVYSSYGDPGDVVQLETENIDPPGPGQVLVKMLAAPINPADINTIQGVYPIKPELPSVPGNEGVGEVVKVGEEVKNLEVGDLVLPRQSAWGTWRSHAIATPEELLKIPPGVDVVSAATMSVNPCTAYRMLKDFVDLEKGDVVIQNGANSACGQSVIQFCKAWGLVTVNIVRDRTDIEKLKCHLMGLGANYILIEDDVAETDLFKDSIPRPKLALNCIGGRNALDMMRHVANKGVMVTYGGMSRQPVTVPTSALIFKDINVRGFWLTRWNKENCGSSEQAVMLTEISSFIKKGKWQPPPYELVPLEDYKFALEQAMNTSGKTGKKFIFDIRKIEETGS